MKRGDTIMSTNVKTVKLRCYPNDEQMNVLPLMFGHDRDTNAAQNILKLGLTALNND